jgi:hypothetical protein
MKLSVDLNRSAVRELRDGVERLNLAAVSVRSLLDDAVREHALPRLRTLLEGQQQYHGERLLAKLELHLK